MQQTKQQWPFFSQNTSTNLKQKHLGSITLSEEDKQRIYRPWMYSIVVKVMGQKINHMYLKTKLKMLWKMYEEIIRIDLGHDYYIAKFFKEENMKNILQNGPSFINEYFISAERWSPNFVASEAKEDISEIWIRLPELPTEFYDHQILARVGKILGKLMKIDICTSQALTGRYAWMCVEIPLETPVKKAIYIGNHKQQIVWELRHLLQHLWSLGTQHPQMCEMEQ